jgi:integrase
VRSEHTKTFRARYVPITNRLQNELEKLWKEVEPDYLANGWCDKETGEEKTIFKISSVKRSFDAVRKIVGIEDLRFHDLRHTAATRLVAQHIPLPEVGRILGHSEINTTYRYANADLDTVSRAGKAIDTFHREQEELAQARAESIESTEVESERVN